MPSVLTRLGDLLASSCGGCLRIRLTASQEGFEHEVVGSPRAAGLIEPRRVVSRILELGPPGVGAIDVKRRDDGTYWLRGSGHLNDSRFLQRVRNVLNNRA